MNFITMRKIFPLAMQRALFGDRDRYGRIPDPTDPSWIEWQDKYEDFYLANQRSRIGLKVNQAGYKIVSEIDFDGRQILEIGPGAIEHTKYWRGRPSFWVNFDVREDLLRVARERIDETDVPHQEVLADPRVSQLPFDDQVFDVVLSFYALEHINYLESHINEIDRVLRPGGAFVGGIPCEGGLAWGLGRYLTSRRWLLNNTNIDPNRLICWEHPNFCDDVLKKLGQHFLPEMLRFWPLKIPSIDSNLVASFIYQKPIC